MSLIYFGTTSCVPPTYLVASAGLGGLLRAPGPPRIPQIPRFEKLYKNRPRDISFDPPLQSQRKCKFPFQRQRDIVAWKQQLFKTGASLEFSEGAVGIVIDESSINEIGFFRRFANFNRLGKQGIIRPLVEMPLRTEDMHNDGGGARISDFHGADQFALIISADENAAVKICFKHALGGVKISTVVPKRPSLADWSLVVNASYAFDELVTKLNDSCHDTELLGSIDTFPDAVLCPVLPPICEGGNRNHGHIFPVDVVAIPRGLVRHALAERKEVGLEPTSLQMQNKGLGITQCFVFD